MKKTHDMKWVGIGVRGLILMALLCAVPLANGDRGEKKPPPVDLDQLSDLMGNMALGLEDLAEGAEIQREFFNTITPPGVELFQPMFPSAMPFEDADFTDAFLEGLLGWDRNSVTVYPIQLLLDPETRKTLVYNLKGELIATSPNLWGPRIEWGESDPSRITLRVDLLPSEDVEPYLYTESRIFQSLMEIVQQSKSSGGMATKSSGGTNVFEVIEIETTNSSIAVTFAWPIDFTNRFDIYSFDGGSYTGRASWVLADVGHVSSGTNQLRWVDTGQLGRSASHERMRFYTAGMGADKDSDSDGYGDSYEFLVLHTATNNADTDGDGISDGPFDPDGTNSVTSGPEPSRSMLRQVRIPTATACPTL